MQRTVAIFVNPHTGLEQVVVGHARRELGHLHVRLPLQNQPHLDTPAGCIANIAQQSIAGKEVRVGDHHAPLCGTQYLAVNLLDVGPMLAVVAIHQAHLSIVIAERQLRAALATSLPPVPGAHRAPALQQGKVMDVGHRRALHFHRVILLGLRAEVGQMVGGKVDPAEEREGPVDDHDLAVQAPKPVGADAQAFWRRVEHLQMHTGVTEGSEVTAAQFSATKTIEAGGDAHAAPGRVDQYGLQFCADLVLEDDEGFQEDFAFGLTHGLEHPGEIGFAVFQQLDPVVALPAVLDIDHGRLADRGRGNRVHGGFIHRRSTHSSISTDSGAWSERCDQGRFVSTCGQPAFRLRT